MRKFTILMGLLLTLPCMNLKAQTCGDGMVNAKISVNTGSYIIREGDMYWFLVGKDNDTVAFGGQNKPRIDTMNVFVVAGDEGNDTIAVRVGETTTAKIIDTVKLDSIAIFDPLCFNPNPYTAYANDNEYYYDVCLKMGESYTFYAYEYIGNGWNDYSRYSVEINGVIVANNNNKAPNDGSYGYEYFSHPYTAPYEVAEVFTVPNLFSKDLKAVAVKNPVNNCSFTSSETFTVVVKNNGTSVQDNFVVGLIVDGKDVSKDTIKTTLNPGTQLEYTLKVKGDLSAKGIHEIKVFTSLIGDELLINDTLKTTIENLLLTEATQSNNDLFLISPSKLTAKSQIAFCGLPEMLSDTFGIRMVHIDTLSDEQKSMGNYKIQLVSPNNDTILLSKGHGEDLEDGQGASIQDLGGVGYANITFAYNSKNELDNYAFTTETYCKNTTFAPDERIGFAIANEVNPNGLWSLYVSPKNSGAKRLKGFFKGWSLEFGKIEKASAICDINKDLAFDVFPNPANNELNIRISNMAVGSDYSIINNQGQVVANGKLTALQTTIDVKDLNSGIYFLNLKNDKAIKTTKFSKL